jgi:outer membrane lipoprotein-sorting protein
MNLLRRLPVSRLILLCVLVVAIGVSATALAFALGSGSKPPAKPLAQAVHDALSGPTVEGLSADVTLTNHLLEGANLAQGHGSGLMSNPLITGASGRLWIAKDGRVRLELQAEKGDTQVIYDGHTVTVLDAAENKVYEYTPKQPSGSSETDAKDAAGSGHEQVPSVAKIDEAISNVRKQANLSEANPTNVAGQPAYTVRISPNEGGSLIGGAELSFDASTGLPLRSAVYSSTSSAPVVELAATKVSYGPVPDSVFQISPPRGAKVETLELSKGKSATAPGSSEGKRQHPTVTTHGKGISAIKVLEAKEAKSGSSSALEGLPKVKLGNGVTASELRTALGTVLTFQRSGVRYLVAGAVEPSAVEALAKGL